MFAAANKLAAADAGGHREARSRWPQALGDPKFAADIKGSAEDVHTLLDAIVHGDGTMHRLFYDHAEADQVDAAARRA